MTRYMITEKSEHILKRAIGWLITWKAFKAESKNNPGALESLAGIEALADEQLAKLEQDWQVKECLEGRR